MTITSGYVHCRPRSVHERRVASLYHRYPLIVVLALLALLVAQLRTWWIPAPDASQYISIARSIAQGYGPTRLGLPNLLYQPGYAFLITPAFLVSDRPFLLLSAFQIAVAAVGLYLVWRWARSISPTGALVVVALVCVNVIFLKSVRRYLSEVPSMALLLLACLTVRWACSQVRTTLLGQTGSALLAVLVVCAACMVRYSNICLIPGLLVIALLQYFRPCSIADKTAARRNAALALLCGTSAITLMVSWIIHDRQQAPVGASNLDYMLRVPSTLVFRLLDTLRMRCSVFGQLVLPGLDRTHTGPGEWFNAIYLLFGPVLVLVVWGWWKLLLRTRDALVAAAPFYFAIYVVWPDDANTRFFMPVLPIIWMCLWHVMASWRQWRYLLATTLVAVHLCAAVALQVREQLRDGREWNRIYAHLVTLAPQLQPWRQSVAVRGMADGAPFWLGFEVDRVVKEISIKQPVPADVQVVVQLQDRPLPPGFVALAGSGPLVAARRDAAVPASPPAATSAPTSMPTLAD